MDIRQSRGPARRLLLRLGPGDELVTCLREMAQARGVELAWVQGVGTIERASFVGGQADSDDGPWQLMSLGGSVREEGGVVALSLHATLVSASGQVKGGALRKAAVSVAEIVVECFESPSTQQGEAAEAFESTSAAPARKPTTERRARKPKRAASEPPPRSWTMLDDAEDEPDEAPSPAPPTGAVTWADVAAFSAAPEEEAPAPRSAPASRPRRSGRPGHKPMPPPSKQAVVDELLPQKGDFVSHRQFGTCKVEREDGNGGIVLKLQSGVRKTIKLAYMEVGAPRDEKGRRVFPIRPRKR
ncbi:MAG: DUF296 domain-containing protein [Sandaracinaceae bacterium]